LRARWVTLVQLCGAVVHTRVLLVRAGVVDVLLRCGRGEHS
jgi:hypothetical protein